MTSPWKEGLVAMRSEETKILQVKEIDKTYAGGNHAVKQVSFDIYKGECMGLVGESGHADFL